MCVSDASRSLPEFPELKDEGKPLPDGLHPQHVHTYQLIYREHCEVSVCAGCQMCGYFSVLVSNVCVCVCVSIGDSGRDGKPAVPSCGDALEEFLAVQWRTKQRHGFTRPVRHIGLKYSHKCCDVVLCLTDVSVSTVMMNQRSVCLSRFWSCCVNMSPSSTGLANATIYCTKA